MYCQQCGAENSPDSSFCIRCGASLDSVATPTSNANLEDGLLDAVRILGPEILSDADRLRSGLSDICDHGSKEYLVFMRSCNADYLKFFQRPLQTRQANDFKHAASMAEGYLHGTMAEDASMAQAVSRATASALTTYTGAGRLQWTETKAQPANYPPPDPTPIQTPPPVPPANTVPPVNNAYNPYPATPNKRSGGSGFAIALVAIVAIGIVVGVLFGTGILSFDGSRPITDVNGHPQDESYLTLSKQNLPTYWQGWYYGYTAQNASHTTKRACDIQLTSVMDDGSLTGICFVSMHAESVNDIHCSFNVSGSIDWDTGRIVLDGTGWVDKGNSEGWGDFEGYVTGDDWSSITGTWYSAGDHSTNGDWYMDAL